MRRFSDRKAKWLVSRFVCGVLPLIAGLTAMPGVARAADECTGGEASPGMQLGVPVADKELQAVRGMGAAAVRPDTVAVILWDERNGCCLPPGSGQLAEPGRHAVAIRLVTPGK